MNLHSEKMEIDFPSMTLEYIRSRRRLFSSTYDEETRHSYSAASPSSSDYSAASLSPSYHSEASNRHRYSAASPSPSYYSEASISPDSNRHRYSATSPSPSYYSKASKLPPVSISAASKSPSPLYSPTSLSLVPHEDGLSPDSPSTFTIPIAGNNRRPTEIALDYYNKENGTDYELVDVLVSKSFLCLYLGHWLHCNFTAKPLSGDISPKLFFAEMLRVCSPDAEYTWAVNACIILEGKTCDGCDFCRNIIHPTHGFSQGNHKSKRKGLPPIVNRALPDYEKRCRRAEIALEYYNKENATDYELVEPLLSNNFSSDGTWYHCNFAARQDVNGKYTCRIFFAEMSGDVSSFDHVMETLTVTACLNLEGCETPAGCALCSNVIHPTCGFLKGVCNPKLNVIHSKAKRKRHPESPKPYGEELSQKHLKLAKIAVEYYNKENGANYEVIDALACNPFFSYGIWYHINFTAKPPNGDMSPKLFFAEILRFNKDNPAIEWTFYACLILEGKTTDGCNFCRDSCPRVIHPIHGFSQGIHKSKRIRLEPTIHCKLPENEKCAIRAEIALDYYNKENGTDYEFVENYGSNCFSSDGTLRNCNSVSKQDIDRTWYHCSFTAWRVVDGKYTSRIFFAELFGYSSSPYSDMMENLTVTACVDLKDCETTTGCAVCSGVKHPTHGFLEGVRKPVPEFYSPTSPYPPAYYSPSYPSSCIPYPHPVDAPYPGRSRSKLAVEYYNQKNGTEYELVDALVSNGLVSDGTWLHFNFTAKARNGDSYHKKHFFAEMFGVLKYSCIEFTWKVTACVILEEGETSAGCCLCPDSEVIHPTRGFLKGLHKCVV